MTVSLTVAETHEIEIRKGGEVFTPKPGIYHDVVILDFAMFYPAILILLNISKELMHLSLEERMKRKPGIIPNLCLKLIEQRFRLEEVLDQILVEYGPDAREFKITKNKRDVKKFRLNAVFGYGLYSKSRFYDEIGMSLMLEMARRLLKFIVDKAKEYGFEFIYGDTDSGVFKCPLDKVFELEKIIQDAINEACQQIGVRDDLIKIKAERYASLAVFVRKKGGKEGAKKKYIMRIIREFSHGITKVCDYPYIKGIALIRGDQSIITKDLQRSFIEAIFAGKVEEEIELIKNITKQLRGDFYNYDDIAINMNLSRNLENYKQNTEYVQGCRYANKHLGKNFRKGDRIKMLFIENIPNMPRTKIICFQDIEELPKNLTINVPKTIERLVYNKIEMLLEATGYSLGDLKNVKSLDVFF